MKKDGGIKIHTSSLILNKKMTIYFFLVLFYKYLHADIRRAAWFYRWVFLLLLTGFAVFMWTLSIISLGNM